VQLLLQEKMVRITRWDSDLAPYAGRWATIVNGTTQYLQTKEGQILPTFEDRHGKKYRACWSLLERDDKGSLLLFLINPAKAQLWNLLDSTTLGLHRLFTVAVAGLRPVGGVLVMPEDAVLDFLTDVQIAEQGNEQIPLKYSKTCV
jgi:hypothetical protein